MNNNYKLYKLIFSNIYLKNLIYKFVCKDIYKLNDKILKYKYDDIDLDYIIKSKNYNLLKDKLKSNSAIKNINISRVVYKFTFCNLTTFIINLKNDLNYKNDQDEINKILINFYNVNNLFNLQQQQQHLIKSETSSRFIEKGKTENPIDLIECFLNSNCTILLKQLYNDYNNDVFGIKNESFSITKSRFNNENEILKVYERVLSGNDIEMLDFIFNEIKLPITYQDFQIINQCKVEYWNDFKNKALHWSVNSENRDEMVDYLLNKIKYKVPTDYIGSFDGFFDNLLKLDHKLLKSLINDHNAPILFTSYPINTEFAIPLSLKFIQLKKLIDFVQNSLFSSIIQKKKQSSSSSTFGFEGYFENLLNKIDLLLEYNNLIKNSNQEERIKKIKNKILNIENLHLNKSNLIYKFKDSKEINIFGISVPSFLKRYKNQEKIETNHYEISNSIFLKPSKVSFINEKELSTSFNLEREIKKIYIFDFLIPSLLKGIQNDISYLSIKSLSNFIVNFSRQFNEFEMILDFKNFITIVSINDQSNKNLDNRAKEFNLNTILIDTCQEIATQNADNQFLLFLFQNFKDNSNDTISYNFIHLGKLNKADKEKQLINQFLISYKSIPIEIQIQYFSNLLKFNINYPLSIYEIFKNILIISNQQPQQSIITIEQLDEIANNIKNYYNDHFDDGTFKTGKSYLKKIPAYILKLNRFIGDYFYLKYSNLFHNWNEYYY